MTELQAGTLLKQGRYRLISPLGKGGQAEVWEAEQHGPDDFSRGVVIKCINFEDPQHTNPTITKKTILREARLAARLSHPNIIKIHEVVEEDSLLYLVMERIDGCDLQTLSKQCQHHLQRPLPWPIVVAIAIEICKALHYSHNYVDRNEQARPVIHRDIKPSNILLSRAGFVKVIDYGIAKSLGQESYDQITLKGHVKGTPAYMAPEQLLNQPLGPHTDLFSLGVVLYELCAGRPPFQGGHILQVAAAIISQPAPPLCSLVPDAPAALESLLEQLLSKSPVDRPEKASLVQRSLAQIVGQVGHYIDQETLGRYCKYLRSQHPLTPQQKSDLLDLCF
ncbi:MAG: serine/threonine protein kinase [Myxococcales bacterium]|nr:serine/threonine protein kinase [Myxococcales bacterium]MCB9643093.1 serine/threonine protein kinase [Myxococcales bacterium]